MATTSIPKARLINLIVQDLKAETQAVNYFNIGPDINLEERLESFTKDQLLTFIVQLGKRGEAELKKLETSFPLRRPPTLYVVIIKDKSRITKETFEKSDELAEQGQKSGMSFGDNDTIRSIYLPQGGISRFQINRLAVFEIQLHYERRIEYVESDLKKNYGQLSEIYSLETAFVWIPITKHNHAIIACSDYPALRRIRNFLQIMLDIELNPPWLNKEMLEKITQGSVPRSVTYSLNALTENEDEPQSITIADPDLLTKSIFKSLAQSDREQVSGFYTAHPGLSLGGIGVARRDGKIWTPRKLDRREILDLSIEIIQQTETELSKVKDLSILLRYFHANHASIGDTHLREPIRELWLKLALLILGAVKNRQKESEIDPDFVITLVKHQHQLKLLTSIKYDCPSCGLRWLAKCPDCLETLTLTFDADLHSVCPKCKRIFDEHIFCVECGAKIEAGDIVSNVCIVPDKELNESIKDMAGKAGITYDGLWMIDGLSLFWVGGKTVPKYPILSLSDFQLWRRRAKINNPASSNLSSQMTFKILNQTLEKCKRDGTTASSDKCKQCVDNLINPKWIKKGETCLLRLFGLPIDQKFEGLHHKHELADIRYKDTLVGKRVTVNIGIHVKSRHTPCPPEGMGLSKYQIQGLYKQSVYSAFQSAVHGKDLQVIGIAIPNVIRKEVEESLAYAINTLGFSFLVIDEKDWVKVIRLAYEQASFDFA